MQRKSLAVPKSFSISSHRMISKKHFVLEYLSDLNNLIFLFTIAINPFTFCYNIDLPAASLLETTSMVNVHSCVNGNIFLIKSFIYIGRGTR